MDQRNDQAGNAACQTMSTEELRELEELRQFKAEHSKVICIYCHAMFERSTDEETVKAVADHIFSCEKSPVVGALTELCEQVMPMVDLWDSIREGMGTREPVSIYLANNPEQLSAVVVALNALSKSLNKTKALFSKRGGE